MSQEKNKSGKHLKKCQKGVFVTFCAISVVVAVSDQMKNRNSEHRQGFYERHIKRVQDFWCGLTGLAALSPVMAVTAALVKAQLGSPVIFKQKRPGKDGRAFELYKFRTMTDGRDGNGNLLPDEERLTGFGKWLRSTSLDELPELVNIIRGDMSVVGPRPLLVEYLPRYNEEQKRRHEVRPGLTGLAQVSGRNGLSWDEKFKDDVEYVDGVTFLGDLRILLRTVAVVAGKKGISSRTSGTMEEFHGSGG